MNADGQKSRRIDKLKELLDSFNVNYSVKKNMGTLMSPQ